MNLAGSDSLPAKVLTFLWDMRPSLIMAVGFLLFATGSIRQRHWMRAVLSVLLAFLALALLPSLLSYLQGLSADSFAELSNPKASEARFFLSTIDDLLEMVPMRKLAALVVATFVMTSLTLAVARLWTRGSARRMCWTGGLLCGGLILVASGALWRDYRQSEAIIDRIRANYAGPVPAMQGHPRPLHVVVYIGESTSVMDLHLYGYHRQTTPRLDARRLHDPGLLVYDLALSAHTHTGASLMDVFGIPLDPPARSAVLPIYERRYASVVDALGQAGVDSALVSNQGRHGTWNAGGAAVFAHAGTIVSAFDSAALGNNEPPEDLRVDDDDLFRINLPKVWKPGRSQVVFLHSYAGHGPYLKNIPSRFRTAVDNSFGNRDSHAVAGDTADAPVIMKSVDDYDSAMRYVDYSVDAVMAYAQAQPDPVVTIYFSDHGESPWTGRSHDSSRFIHEMMRVPLLVHFNDGARTTYPDLFARFRDDSRQRRPRLLSSIAGTLLTLFDLSTAQPLETLFDDERADGKLHGEVVRRVDSTMEAIFPLRTPNSPPLPDGWRDTSDIATRVFRLTAARARADSATEEPPSFCYHRANTMARARRAAMVADCVEFDVAPNGAALEVNHPPVAFTGYALREHFQVLEGSGKGLWIDSKDLGGPERCAQLATMLESWTNRPRQILVEFAPTIEPTESATAACLVRLRALGARRSFYVPTEAANACSEFVRAGHPDAPVCTRLSATLVHAMASGLLSDLSFDFAGYDAMRSIPVARSLRWDTWGVAENEVSAERLKGFGFVIIDVATDMNFH